MSRLKKTALMLRCQKTTLDFILVEIYDLINYAVFILQEHG